MLNVLVFICVVLLALSGGTAFTHVMEIPGKRRLSADTVVAVQNNLYVGYRYIGLAIELATLVALIGAAAIAFGDGTVFWLTAGALLAELGTAVVFLGWTDRENRKIAGWQPGRSLPNGWAGVGASWELSHGSRALLFLIALACLLGALLVE